jgi:uncharacterized protein (TIGR02001 family)
MGLRCAFRIRVGRGFMAWAAVAFVCTPLYAQSNNFSGAVALSSQLVDRGLAVTPPTPSLQAAVSWTSPAGWSFGLSASTEVRSPGHVTETVAQASRYWSLSSDWQMQASALYYDYPGNARGRVFDRTETGVNWIYRDVLTLGISAVWPTGSGGNHQPRGAADVDVHWPLPWHLSISAGAGVAQPLLGAYSLYGSGQNSYGYVYEHPSVYGYGHAGLTWSNGPWRAELDRIVTDPGSRRQWGSLAASPWVGTMSWSF